MNLQFFSIYPPEFAKVELIEIFPQLLLILPYIYTQLAHIRNAYKKLKEKGERRKRNVRNLNI
jgi:hypothetical protein